MRPDIRAGGARGSLDTHWGREVRVTYWGWATLRVGRGLPDIITYVEFKTCGVHQVLPGPVMVGLGGSGAYCLTVECDCLGNGKQQQSDGTLQLIPWTVPFQNEPTYCSSPSFRLFHFIPFHGMG